MNETEEEEEDHPVLSIAPAPVLSIAPAPVLSIAPAPVQQTDGHYSHPPPAPGGRKQSRDRIAPIYGELVVLG